MREQKGVVVENKEIYMFNRIIVLFQRATDVEQNVFINNSDNSKYCLSSKTKKYSELDDRSR